MTIWAYEAYSGSGQRYASQIDAATRNDAYDRLVDSGLLPAQIVPYRGLERAFDVSMVMSWFTDRRRDASKMNLYEGLLLFGGRTVDEALSAQVEYVQDPELAVVVREMLAYHRFHNVGLGPCMASQRPYFSDAECNIVAAAEDHAADRNIGLQTLIDNRNRRKKFSGLMLKALGPSMVLLTMCYAVCAFMGPKIHEIYDPMFQGSDVPFPLMSEVVADIGSFIGSPLGILAAIAAVIGARLGYRYALRDPRLADLFDRVRFKLPFRLGQLCESIVLTNFCFLYGHLRRTGADYGDVAEWVAPTLGSRRYEAACLYIAKRHRQDQVQAYDSMVETGVFGKMFLQAAGPGFAAGKPEEVLIPLAARYEQQIDSMSTPIAWTLSMASGAVTSAFITCIMLATYLPSWALESHAQI